MKFNPAPPAIDYQHSYEVSANDRDRFSVVKRVGWSLSVIKAAVFAVQWGAFPGARRRARGRGQAPIEGL